MVATILIVSSVFFVSIIVLFFIGCCLLRKKMRKRHQRSSYIEYSDQEPFVYGGRYNQPQHGSMDLSSPDDDMIGNHTKTVDFSVDGNNLQYDNTTTRLNMTEQYIHTPPPTRTVAFSESYNIMTTKRMGGGEYTPPCIRGGILDSLVTSSSLPASPSPFDRMKSRSVTGCSPRFLSRPKFKHNSVSGKMITSPLINNCVLHTMRKQSGSNIEIKYTRVHCSESQA